MHAQADTRKHVATQTHTHTHTHTHTQSPLVTSASGPGLAKSQQTERTAGSRQQQTVACNACKRAPLSSTTAESSRPPCRLLSADTRPPSSDRLLGGRGACSHIRVQRACRASLSNVHKFDEIECLERIDFGKGNRYSLA
jgi:hypothetical protein